MMRGHFFSYENHIETTSHMEFASILKDVGGVKAAIDAALQPFARGYFPGRRRPKIFG